MTAVLAAEAGPTAVVRQLWVFQTTVVCGHVYHLLCNEDQDVGSAACGQSTHDPGHWSYGCHLVSCKRCLASSTYAALPSEFARVIQAWAAGAVPGTTPPPDGALDTYRPAKRPSSLLSAALRVPQFDVGPSVVTDATERLASIGWISPYRVDALLDELTDAGLSQAAVDAIRVSVALS